MTFLLLEDEHATLEAALAFLDACTSDDSRLSSDCSSDLDTDWIAQEIGSSSSSDDLWPSARDRTVHSSSITDDTNGDDSANNVASAHHSASVYPIAEPDDHPTVPQNGSRRQQTVASRVRKRPIDEIFTLRERVVQLTAQLSQLQKRGGKAVTSPNGASLGTPDCQKACPISESVVFIEKKALAYSDAVQELQKLQKSENVNRRLRAAWRQQIRLAKRLENLIKKQLAPMDENSFLDAKSEPLIPATRARDNSVTRDATRTMAELRRCLESADLQSASISSSIGLQDTSRVFSSSHVYHDTVVGEMFEFTTNTPLVCDLQELDAYIPTLLSSLKTSLEKRYRVKKPSQTDGRLENQFTKTFDCQFGEILVNVVSVGRKIKEPRQIVLSYSSLIELSGTEVTFQETAWLIMKQVHAAPGDSERSASPFQHVLLQACHRIHPVPSPEEVSSASDTSESTEYFKNFILQSQCEEMRAKQLHIQTGARQKFGSQRGVQV